MSERSAMSGRARSSWSRLTLPKTQALRRLARRLAHRPARRQTTMTDSPLLPRVLGKTNNAPDRLALMSHLQPLPSTVDRIRRLALFKGEDSFGRNLLLLGTLSRGSHLWSDRPTEIVGLGTTEIWEIYNATVSGHPIHLHLVEFQVLGRQPFKGTVVPKYHKDHHGRRLKGGKLRDVTLAGKTVVPVPGGPTDTVISLPGQVTRIIAHFDRPGHYVWHCHLLSHEDWDMMRPLEIREEPFTRSKT